jgi:integrase
MKRREILFLKWEQVRGGLLYLEKTKTNEARQIPGSDGLEAVFKVFKEIRRREHPRSEYVFTFRQNRITGNVKKAFAVAVKKAGRVDFHFHDLRDTFACRVLF